MQKTLKYERTVAIAGEYDVVVAGGGMAGIGAAVASARAGAKTALIEYNPFLGGNATAGFVLKFHGFEFRGIQVVRGIPLELVERMQQRGGARRLGSYDGIMFDPEVCKSALDDLVASSGCDVALYAHATELFRLDSGRLGVLVEGRCAASVYACAVLVDAAGDGRLAVSAGGRVRRGRELDEAMQAMAVSFRMGGVRPFERDDVRAAMDAAHARGELPPFGGPWIDFFNLHPRRRDEVLVNTLRAWGNAADSRHLTRASVDGRKDACRLADVLRRSVPAFRDAYILDTSTAVGVRETNHMCGDYTLTADDVLSGRRFEDGIAAGMWSIDIHSPVPSCAWRSTPLRDYYTIPYRCLLPNGVENVLVPGRAVAATHEAWASARVMATCMAMGQAAGTAAAVAVRNGVTPRQLCGDFGTLRERLLAQDVFLG